MAILLLAGGAHPLEAGTAETAPPRVRTQSAAIAAAIRHGSSHSPTFRALMDAVNATDGLIWVEEGTCGGSVRACLKLSVRVAGPYRLLRVVVDARRTRRELIASLGHELCHALEALSDPAVRSDGAIFFFFQQHGEPSGARFETDAAVQAGHRVWRELAAARWPPQ